MPLPPGQAFIWDGYSNIWFNFQHAPTEISSTKQADLKMTRVPGTTQPEITGTAGGERIIRFSVVYAHEDDEDRDTEWIKEQIDWLSSLTYPRTIQIAPLVTRVVPVFLKLGSLIELPVYVQEVDTNFEVFIDSELDPAFATVRLSFVEAPSREFIDSIGARSNAQYRLRSWESVAQ